MKLAPDQRHCVQLSSREFRTNGTINLKNTEQTSLRPSTQCVQVYVNLYETHNLCNHLLYHHHHHVPERLGVFPVPWSSRWSWSFHLFFVRAMFLRPFGLYCSASFGILFVSIPCTCCSHFFWYCFISSTMFCAPVFSPNTLILFFIQFCYPQ